MRRQLLCTFTTKKEINNVIEDIKKSYTIVFDKIYVLQNENNDDELICTYNISTNGNVDYNDVDNTISLHRKKHSNTLYTINALNEVIKNLNNGVLDNKFVIPWENFSNMILVVNSSGLNKIPTRIYKIISINDKKN
tara:strand:+ start:1031 stop:1441 length:411 start_codon:yes stop_codon:yes gene_type:complete